MHKLALPLVMIGAALALSISATPGHAQATRTWVSGVGDDASPCSRTAPCKTFAGALSKTTAAGEINCLDSGGFGAVTITKALTINCEGVIAGIVVSGTNAINVNAPGAVVVLKGLDIEGVGSGLAGINIIAAAAVQIHNSIIRDFNAGAGNGWGIRAMPTAATKVDVTNTIVSNSGSATTGGGILIRPAGAGTVTGVLSQVKILNNNGNGLVVDGSTSAGTQMEVVLRDSVVVGNAVTGVLVTTAAGNTPSRIAIDRTTVAGSNTGVSSTGSGADITIGFSMVSANNTGLSFIAPAELRSYQTNQIRGNILNNGASSSVIPLE
jgi:hypothetical protein